MGDHVEGSPAPAWAYDLNTSTYYSFGPNDSMAINANSNGYVVGSSNDSGGSGDYGFIWNEGTQSYSTIPSLNFAWGISQNSQLVAGQNQSGKAAVYNTSSQTVSTYWNGEATFVNDNGLVVGDTGTGFYYYGYPNARAMAEIGGQQVDLTAAYAPAGVTFDFCEGVNDAGQILVWSGSTGTDTDRSFLLTPALPGDANLDGKVDINDLTIVLAHYGQTGMTWAHGEFTGDGTVDINDLTIVLAHYDQTAGSSAGGLAAVPEPGAIALLTAGMAGLLACAWRKRG